MDPLTMPLEDPFMTLRADVVAQLWPTPSKGFETRIFIQLGLCAYLFAATLAFLILYGISLRRSNRNASGNKRIWLWRLVTTRYGRYIVPNVYTVSIGPSLCTSPLLAAYLMVTREIFLHGGSQRSITLWRTLPWTLMYCQGWWTAFSGVTAALLISNKDKPFYLRPRAINAFYIAGLVTILGGMFGVGIISSFAWYHAYGTITTILNILVRASQQFVATGAINSDAFDLIDAYQPTLHDELVLYSDDYLIAVVYDAVCTLALAAVSIVGWSPIYLLWSRARKPVPVRAGHLHCSPSARDLVLQHHHVPKTECVSPRSGVPSVVVKLEQALKNGSIRSKDSSSRTLVNSPEPKLPETCDKLEDSSAFGGSTGDPWKKKIPVSSDDAASLRSADRRKSYSHASLFSLKWNKKSARPDTDSIDSQTSEDGHGFGLSEVTQVAMTKLLRSLFFSTLGVSLVSVCFCINTAYIAIHRSTLLAHWFCLEFSMTLSVWSYLVVVSICTTVAFINELNFLRGMDCPNARAAAEDPEPTAHRIKFEMIQQVEIDSSAFTMDLDGSSSAPNNPQPQMTAAIPAEWSKDRSSGVKETMDTLKVPTGMSEHELKKQPSLMTMNSNIEAALEYSSIVDESAYQHFF